MSLLPDSFLFITDIAVIFLLVLGSALQLLVPLGSLSSLLLGLLLLLICLSGWRFLRRLLQLPSVWLVDLLEKRH